MARTQLPDHMLEQLSRIEHERAESAAKRGQTQRLEPGDRIRFTGRFLKQTGQFTGSAGRETYVVRACDCKQCRDRVWVCTTERRPDNDDPSIGHIAYLHIARVNVHKVGVADHRNDP